VEFLPDSRHPACLGRSQSSTTATNTREPGGAIA
jgi:hypothetical protein